jgi:hypothetical protein
VSELKNLRGVIHGKVIELEEPLGLPDGQAITITISSKELLSPTTIDELPGFGALAEAPEEVDEFDAWYRNLRRLDRRSEELEP